VEAGRGVRIEELATGPTRLAPRLLVLAPGATSDGAHRHAGEEFMFVLAGRVAVWLGGRERHELEPGDALTYASTIPLRFVAVGSDEARILWVTPPTS
jgi:quercetin dioxygenase-like cupin family protein